MSTGTITPFAGLPGSSGSSAGAHGSGSSRQPPPKKQRTDHGREQQQRSVSKEICNSWNNGSCVAEGPCPHGRRHVCRVCPPWPGGTHRACHAHKPGDRNRRKGKGKGKDQSGDKDKVSGGGQ